MIVLFRSVRFGAAALAAALALSGCYSKYAAEDEAAAKATGPTAASRDTDASTAVSKETSSAAAVPSPDARGFWVQVGSHRSEDVSEAMWARLRTAHPATLGSASHRVVQVNLPGKGVFHRLQVGPQPTAISAGDLCGRLKAQSVDCFVVSPEGAILAQPRSVRANVEPARPVETRRIKPVEEETLKPVETKRAKPVETERAKPVETKPTKPTEKAAPAKPETKKDAASVDATDLPSNDAKPAASAPTEAAPADAPAEPSGSAAASDEEKPGASKSDVPFRSMGLPGLPE